MLLVDIQWCIISILIKQSSQLIFESIFTFNFDTYLVSDIIVKRSKNIATINYSQPIYNWFLQIVDSF